MKGVVCIGWGLLAAATALALAASAGEGEGSYEKIVKEMLGKTEEIAKTLTTIKDKASADAAQPLLKDAAAKMLVLRKQAEEIKQPSKEEKDRLAKEYAPKLEAAVTKLRSEMRRVEEVPGSERALAELAVLKDKKDKEKKDVK